MQQPGVGKSERNINNGGWSQVQISYIFVLYKLNRFEAIKKVDESKGNIETSRNWEFKVANSYILFYFWLMLSF
jgi:hypothetical protein